MSVTVSLVLNAQNPRDFNLVEGAFHGTDMPFNEAVGLKVVWD